MTEYGYWLDSRQVVDTNNRIDALTQEQPLWLHLDRTQDFTSKVLKKVAHGLNEVSYNQRRIMGELKLDYHKLPDYERNE